MERTLYVYMNEVFVGELAQCFDGSLAFTYSPRFLNQSTSGISLSLPLQSETFEGYAVKAFFSGLLPDDIIRKRLARYLGLSENNTFALLEAIGGDCAGGVSFYPKDQELQDFSEEDVEVLDKNHLRYLLERLTRYPLLADVNNLRFSLAGAQEKIATGFHNGKVCLIKGGHPTTHILKPPIEDIADSAYNELFCMRLARKVGLAAPDATLYFVDDVPCYIVKRYDRILDDTGHVARLHQEDFCQALGILPEMKYEREGGPDIEQCRHLISSHSVKPGLDHLYFQERIIFNYLIGNSDAHGKNYSLLYRGSKPELAPVYDLLSTNVYQNLSNKMAMNIGGCDDPDKISLHHWYGLVPETRSARANLEKQLKNLAIKALDHMLDLKQSFIGEGWKSPVIDDICSLIEKRASILREIVPV